MEGNEPYTLNGGVVLNTFLGVINVEPIYNSQPYAPDPEGAEVTSFIDVLVLDDGYGYLIKVGEEATVESAGLFHPSTSIIRFSGGEGFVFGSFR